MAGKSLCPEQLPGLLTCAEWHRVQYSVPSSVPHSRYHFCPLPHPTPILLSSFLFLCPSLCTLLLNFIFSPPHNLTLYSVSGFQKIPQLSCSLRLSSLPHLSLAPYSTFLGCARRIPAVQERFAAHEKLCSRFFSIWQHPL